MANVKQVTRETSLWSKCQHVGIWCRCISFGSWNRNYFDQTNQSSATLWVLETCLIVGLLPLMITLISASLSSNTYNKTSGSEDWTFERTESMLSITFILF